MGMGVERVASELLVRGEQGEEAGREEAQDLRVCAVEEEEEEKRLMTCVHSHRLMLSRCSRQICMSYSLPSVFESSESAQRQEKREGEAQERGESRAPATRWRRHGSHLLQTWLLLEIQQTPDTAQLVAARSRALVLERHAKVDNLNAVLAAYDVPRREVVVVDALGVKRDGLAVQVASRNARSTVSGVESGKTRKRDSLLLLREVVPVMQTLADVRLHDAVALVFGVLEDSQQVWRDVGTSATEELRFAKDLVFRAMLEDEPEPEVIGAIDGAFEAW